MRTEVVAALAAAPNRGDSSPRRPGRHPPISLGARAGDSLLVRGLPAAREDDPFTSGQKRVGSAEGCVMCPWAYVVVQKYRWLLGFSFSRVAFTRVSVLWLRVWLRDRGRSIVSGESSDRRSGQGDHELNCWVQGIWP